MDVEMKMISNSEFKIRARTLSQMERSESWVQSWKGEGINCRGDRRKYTFRIKKSKQQRKA
jgi:hypothetical protein